MRNLKLTIRYDGTDFAGWQTQPGYRTVQETLEQAFSQLTGEAKVRLNASGRTDAGVHAIGQVANVYTSTAHSCQTILRAINARLPADVVLRHVEDAAQSFDANKDALRKMYRYVLHDHPIPDIFLRRFATHCRHSLDADRMHRAAQALLGRHDFRSFETDWPNRLTSIRTITHIEVRRVGEYVWLDVEADGFLYNMVRAIAGTLIAIGRGVWPVEQMERILRAEDRRQAGSTAPPQGLFLMHVTYADCKSESACEHPAGSFLAFADEK